LNVKIDRKDILEPKIGAKVLHEINDDNGVTVVNFSRSKNRITESTMFLILT
jgi:hypothetical protein